MIQTISAENVLGSVFMYTSWVDNIYMELRNHMAPRAGKPFILLMTQGTRGDMVALYKMSKFLDN